MNKSIIALAIAAALPIAAQADATISGSVSVKYTTTSVANTAALKIASSEVLANGMTATASINVLGTTDQGTATLAGDFGTLTAGTIGDDAAYQVGDVAGLVAAAATTAVSDGIHYSGSVGDFTVAAQTNSTNTQFAATYDLNGLTVGFGQDSNGSKSVSGASYSFGDLSVKVGKVSSAAKAVGSATYTSTFDAITVTATASSDSSNSLSGAYTLDGITLTAKSARTAAGVTSSSLTAKYVSGDLTITADNDSAFSAALDLGNADLTLARSGKSATTAPSTTSLTYKVAF